MLETFVVQLTAENELEMKLFLAPPSPYFYTHQYPQKERRTAVKFKQLGCESVRNLITFNTYSFATALFVSWQLAATWLGKRLAIPTLISFIRGEM